MRSRRSRRRLGLLVLLTVALSVGLIPAQADAGRNGPILYSVVRSHTLPSDGLHALSRHGHLRRLPLPVQGYDGVYSDDGRHVLFSVFSEQDSALQIFLTDRRGRLL